MSYNTAYTLYTNAQKEDNPNKSLDLYIQCITLYIDIYKQDTNVSRCKNMYKHIQNILNEAEDIKNLIHIKKLPSV